MRELATIRRISELLPIEGADLIVTAVIDGWTVVVKKDEFMVGDKCVYFEIDSFLPDGDPRWQHLVDKSSRMFEGGKGHKLRTVRLRGQLSQGFAVPVGAFYNDFVGSKYDEGQELSEFFRPGADLTEFLNIKKWEASVPSELSGMVKGNYPSFIPKTDQARCQNIAVEIFINQPDSEYEESMKMDGTSFSAYLYNELNGVCSRNWDLTVDSTNDSNSLVRMYIDSGLRDALAKIGSNYAVQGELMGPGIQNNRESFTSTKLFIFDIYDIDAATYLAPADRHAFLEKLYLNGLNLEMVKHVPVFSHSTTLSALGIGNIKELLARAEGPSLVHPVSEGKVYKRKDGKFSFKVISNKFLLKESD